jgi:hypothetical protein
MLEKLRMDSKYSDDQINRILGTLPKSFFESNTEYFCNKSTQTLYYVPSKKILKIPAFFQKLQTKEDSGEISGLFFLLNFTYLIF